MESTVAEWLDRPSVRLAIMLVVLLMLVFLAGKAGFSLWLLSKMNLSKEHLSGPPGSAAQALGAYDTIKLMPDLYL
jgi:uncharacterized membrane protein YcfT